MLKPSLSVRLTTDQRAELDKIAAERNGSVGAVVRDAVKLYLKVQA